MTIVYNIKTEYEVFNYTITFTDQLYLQISNIYRSAVFTDQQYLQISNIYQSLILNRLFKSLIHLATHKQIHP